MKRFIILLATLLMPVVMFSQAQINTKKVQIEDFSEKVTKVVLTGNFFLDTELENSVKDCWRISPYEFCSMEEFKTLQGNSDYYFLLVISTRYRKESKPGLMMLTLLKGGKGADKGLGKMLEVASVPLCSVEYPSGREMSFMPALIDIVQTHAAASMKRDVNGYGGLKVTAKSISSARSKRIVFAESDFSVDLDESELKSLVERQVLVVPDEDADRLMSDMPDNTLVSYSVYPTDVEPNSYCYNMLIDARTHELYYYRKYKIKENSGAGFIRDDIIKIFK